MSGDFTVNDKPSTKEVFSSGDLKRLKDRLKRMPNIDVCNYFEDDTEINALLARLEAAEMCCQFMWISENPIDDSATDAYKAWRKSKGE